MIAGKSAAFARAHAFLERLVEKTRREGNKRLPTVHTLAAQAGVGPVTMLKAVRALRDQGVLTVSQGSGIHLVSAEKRQLVPVVTQDGPPRELKQKWEKIGFYLRRDILRGVHPPGSALPSPKELSKKYGVCPRTLRKAVTALVAEGTVVPYKRGYSVPVLAGGRHYGTVVLIARGDAAGNIHVRSHRTREHLRALETECSQTGVNLLIAVFDYEDMKLFLHGKEVERLDTALRNDSVLGFFVLPAGISTKVVDGIVQRALRLERPVSVLDETGEYGLSGIGMHRGMLRLVSVAHSNLAGREVGRHLLSLGHRRVAYISTYHSGLWSQNRLSGLASVFEQAGLAGSVVSFTVEAGRVSDPSIVRKLDAEAYDHSDTLLSIIRQVTDLRNEVKTAVRRQGMRRKVLPLMVGALQDSGATAWVGANDDVALSCLEFLRQHDKRVPNDMSVVGFDDTPEAFYQKLTSYNFNPSAVVHTMLTHLLAPERNAGRGGGRRMVEVEGFVSVRASSGKAPAKVH